MSEKIEVWVHRVIVFSTPAPEGKKVRMHEYLSPRVWLVHDWFAEDNPKQTIVRLFSLGTFKAKMDKKLRMVQLQLQKARLDHQMSKDNPDDQPINGQGVVLDRNELLNQILQKNKNK